MSQQKFLVNEETKRALVHHNMWDDDLFETYISLPSKHEEQQTAKIKAILEEMAHEEYLSTRSQKCMEEVVGQPGESQNELS